MSKPKRHSSWATQIAFSAFKNRVAADTHATDIYRLILTLSHLYNFSQSRSPTTPQSSGPKLERVRAGAAESIIGHSCNMLLFGKSCDYDDDVVATATAAVSAVAHAAPGNGVRMRGCRRNAVSAACTPEERPASTKPKERRDEAPATSLMSAASKMAVDTLRQRRFLAISVELSYTLYTTSVVMCCNQFVLARDPKQCCKEHDEEKRYPGRFCKIHLRRSLQKIVCKISLTGSL